MLTIFVMCFSFFLYFFSLFSLSDFEIFNYTEYVLMDLVIACEFVEKLMVKCFTEKLVVKYLEFHIYYK